MVLNFISLLILVVNGGITNNDLMAGHLAHLDGAMLDREAYHNPWRIASWDATFYAEAATALTREQVGRKCATT